MTTPQEKSRPGLMKALHRAWSMGFVRGREYEALDTLEAMRRVGEFELTDAELGELIELAETKVKPTTG